MAQPSSTGPPARRRWQRVVVAVLSGAALLYAAALAALWFGQEKLLFHPRPLPTGHRFALGPDVHEVAVEVPGARLHGLHLRLPRPDGVVFFLHGNAGNVASWFVNADFYRRANFDLFMIDYRGFGKSGGHIESQAQLEADVRAAWAQVAARYTGQRRVIYGRSIGTGLAAALAADVQPELTVLVSPYESLRTLARERYPWVPDWVLRYPLRTDEWLVRIRAPIFMIHGGRDTVIPASHSQRLQARVPQAMRLLVPEAGHNDVQQFDAYLDGLRNALAAR